MAAARRLFAAAALALAAVAAPAQPGELKRVLVLIAAEVSDPAMAKMVRLDVQTFRTFLGENLPAGQVVVAELSGAELTADRVLAHYRELDVRPTDALVFYYTGHGTYRAGGAGKRDEHTLEFQFSRERGVSPQALMRKDLRAAMTGKAAGLTVLLTDCCSDHVEVPPPADRARTRELAPPPRTEPTPLGRSLFLTARGVVDMTAASDGQVALCDTVVGSYFTAALRTAAAAQKGRPIDWQAYTRQVKLETERVYKQELARPDNAALARELRGKQIQLPEVFGPLPGGADGPAPAEPATYAVVALHNPTDAPIRLQVRWGPAANWSAEFTAEAGRYRLAAVPQPAGKAAVTAFQVRVNGEVKELPARLVTRAGKPGLDEANVYELPTGKPAARTGKARGLNPDPIDDRP